ncbi:hypothetical protein Q8W25_14910 [Shimia thalassica]|uniref:hypothetical protein n=1 Tax=Shimia thalassica TaxID=1715693 RepID=UPI002495009E|nr:hypothetical protein [Shimia thalassica]MDO6483621.1 hypothetical protein [Shimia thalassica]MDP2495317.1 hypothetical protein [Shimia thalassica]
MTVLRSITRLACAAGLTLAAALPAMADVPITYKDKGRALFQLNVPDFWNVRVGGERNLTAPGEDVTRNVPRLVGLTPEGADDVFVGFIVPRHLSTFEQGLAYMAEIGPHLVKDAQVASREERRIAGYPAMRLAGTGRRNGKNVQFTAVLIDMPGNRMAFSVAVLEAGFEPAVLDDINAIYDSFRAVR